MGSPSTRVSGPRVWAFPLRLTRSFFFVCRGGAHAVYSEEAVYRSTEGTRWLKPNVWAVGGLAARTAHDLQVRDWNCAPYFGFS